MRFNGNFIYGPIQVASVESSLWLCGILNINILDIKITMLEGNVDGLENTFLYADQCKLFND